MGVGAFLLFLVLIVIVVAAAIVLLIAAWLRHEKLDPREDRLERKLSDGREPGGGDRARPTHVRAERDQRAHLQSGR